MGFTGMNCYAPDWLEVDFILNSRQTTQNQHQTRLKTVNGGNPPEKPVHE
jgi:hypothetical protein